MSPHSPHELIVVESARQSKNHVERENPNFVLMVLIGRSWSTIETGDLISETPTRETVLPLNKTCVRPARILGKSAQIWVYISNGPVNPAEPSYWNCVIVLYNKNETFSTLRKIGPRNRK